MAALGAASEGATLMAQFMCVECGGGTEPCQHILAMAGVAPEGTVMPEPMSDERLDFSHYREIAEGGGRMPFNAAAILTMLDEIETQRAEVRRLKADLKELTDALAVHVTLPAAEHESLDEVRRLRRALRLSEASRGVPSGVGRD